MFQCFNSGSWVARELRKGHIDDYVEFVDHVRHVYLDELGVGPAVEAMVFFPFLNSRIFTEGVYLEFIQIVLSLLGPCSP